MNVFGYSRVSTKDQDLELQEKEIARFCGYRKFNLVRIFADKASGKDLERKGFRDLLYALDHNTMDVQAVVIYKLDRIGRSLRNLMDIIEDFKKRKIQLIVIADNIDTTTAQGVLFFQIVGAFAEYERNLINERTKAGIRAAREAGVRFGRPKKEIDMAKVKADIALGIPKTQVAKKYGIGKTLLYSLLDE